VLDFPGGRLAVRRMAVDIGAAVRVRIRAGDVGIALTPPSDISFQNVFPATVREIGVPQEGQVDIRLDAGCTVWARITTRALETMALRPGQVVHALVKSVALTRADVAG
jgi:molybdate transport system ATP-binding protein